jgi:hemolysin III
MRLASQRFSSKEELANAISHTTGAAMSIAALVLMIVLSARTGTGWHLAGSIVFGTALLLLYLSSSMNHWLPLSKVKDFFFTTDQIAIYLLIAGTYTPLCLIAFHGVQGWVYFGIEWGLALIGIILKIVKPVKFEKSVNLYIIVSYLIMGWMIVADVPTAFRVMGSGFLWVIAGGVFYTSGIIFFKANRIRYHHLIWHLFVIMGSICHFFAVYFFVLPIQL